MPPRWSFSIQQLASACALSGPCPRNWTRFSKGSRSDPDYNGIFMAIIRSARVAALAGSLILAGSARAQDTYTLPSAPSASLEKQKPPAPPAQQQAPPQQPAPKQETKPAAPVLESLDPPKPIPQQASTTNDAAKPAASTSNSPVKSSDDQTPT